MPDHHPPVPPSGCSAELASAWSTLPTLDMPRLGELQVAAANWLLPDDHSVDLPPLAAHVVCVTMADAARHALWVDGRGRGDGPAPAGSVRVVPAGLPARSSVFGCAAAGVGFPFFHFYIPAHAFETVGLAGGLELRIPGAGEADPWLRAIVDCLLALHGAADRLSSLELDHVALAALVHIARHYGAEPRFASVRGGLAGWQSRKVVEFIDANLDQTLHVGTLAALVSLSPCHFSRAFHASIGEPPHRFQLKRRLERAKVLLRETDMPVVDVGASVGFDDPSYFSRVLRKETGMAPTTYRRENRTSGPGPRAAGVPGDGDRGS